MNRLRALLPIALAALLALAGCATRPINPPIAQADPATGYRFATRTDFKGRDTLVVLAFSGGGTRAAAFSYGVLEFLKRTGVSGGSFTALAYGLYGDQLFSEYEQRFLKRDVQGALLARAANPFNWWKFIGGTAGRSELAAEYYDEILFNGATFADLDRRKDLLILDPGLGH